MSLLDQIDRAIDGLCPCGAEPREGSAYCGPQCEPTHISDDTDARDAGPLATPMRWRPDLVAAADDTDLLPLGSETHGYTGRFNAQVYERASDQTVWHLRLDDGNRFVGVDLTDVGGRQDPITEELLGRVREAWQRLERELTNPDHAVPGYNQRSGWTAIGYIDATDDPWADVMPALLSRGQTMVFLRPSGDRLGHELAEWQRQTDTRRRRSYHNPPQAVDVSADRLAAFARTAARSMQPLIEAMDAFARQSGAQLTEWQRNTVEQMARTQFVAPRMTGRTGQWLPDEVWAALNQEHQPPAQRVEGAYQQPDPDEPPTDPMARALWLRRRRNTGPGADRLDGRRRRRR